MCCCCCCCSGAAQRACVGARSALCRIVAAGPPERARLWARLPDNDLIVCFAISANPGVLGGWRLIRETIREEGSQRFCCKSVLLLLYGQIQGRWRCAMDCARVNLMLATGVCDGFDWWGVMDGCDCFWDHSGVNACSIRFKRLERRLRIDISPSGRERTKSSNPTIDMLLHVKG